MNYRITKILLCCVLVCFGLSTAIGQNVVSYAGGPNNEAFTDVLKLSDGTYLITGYADDVNWLPGNVTPALIDTAGAYVNGDRDVSGFGLREIFSVSNNIAFIMQVSADMKNILNFMHLPPNTVTSIDKIRSTEVPGQPTGDIFISGKRIPPSGATNVAYGYFIAKLNNNFLNGLPTALTYYFKVEARASGGGNRMREMQPWDVGNDGKVVFCNGEAFDWSWSEMARLDANGNLDFVPGFPRKILELNGGTKYPALTGQPFTYFSYKPTLPDSIWYEVSSGNFDSVAVAGLAVPYSSVVQKGHRQGGFRSYNVADHVYIENDENGNPGRFGKYPIDWFVSAPCLQNSCSGDPGPANIVSPWFTNSINDIVINRKTNEIVIANNIAVDPVGAGGRTLTTALVTLNANGTFKWWRRLYQQFNPVNGYDHEQVIDEVEIDYANDMVVVLAHSKDKDTLNFWSGNQLTNNPSATGVINSFNDPGYNTDVSWMAKYSLADGLVMNSTWIAEFAEGTLTGPKHSDPNMAGWPDPNSGQNSFANTLVNDMTVGPDGRVYIAATGMRTITTATAFLPMPKPDASVASENDFVRVYSANLDTIVYSSILSGLWNPTTGLGGNNIRVSKVIPEPNGLTAVGMHIENQVLTNQSQGNPIPTLGVPAWGKQLPQAREALVAKLGFARSTITITEKPDTLCQLASGKIKFDPPSAISYQTGNEFKVIISQNPIFINPIEIGSLSASAPQPDSINVTIPDWVVSGNYYLKVVSDQPATESIPRPIFIGPANVLASPPAKPVGPNAVCATATPASTYSITQLPNTGNYYWQLEPQNAGSFSLTGTVADTSVTITWNPAFEGRVKVKVIASATCQALGNELTVFVSKPLQAPLALKAPLPSEICQNGSDIPVELLPQPSAFAYSFSETPNSAGNWENGNQPINAFDPNSNFHGNTVISIMAFGVCDTLVFSDTMYIHDRVSKPATPLGPASLCQNNDTVYLTNPMAAALNFTWTSEPSSAATFTPLPGTNGRQVMVNWDSTFTGVARLQVRANGFCNTQTSDKKQVQIDVGTITVRPVILDTGNTVFCQGAGVTTNVVGSTAPNATSYTWTLTPTAAGSITPGPADTTVTINWDAGFNGNAQLVQTAIAGVGNCASISSFAVSYQAKPLPMAPTALASNRNNFCSDAGGNVELSANLGNSTDTLYWFAGSCNGTGIGTGTVTLAAPTDTTTYYAAARNQCGFSPCEMVTLTVNPLPDVPVIMQNGNSLEVSNPVASANYQWLVNGTDVISGATGTTFTPDSNGTYSVMITDNNNCMATSQGVAMVVTGLERTLANSLNVFPNPANNVVRVVLQDKAQHLEAVRVLSITGAQAIAPTRPSHSNREVELYVGNLPAGIYFIEVNTSNGTALKKLLVE